MNFCLNTCLACISAFRRRREWGKRSELYFMVLCLVDTAPLIMNPNVRISICERQKHVVGCESLYHRTYLSYKLILCKMKTFCLVIMKRNGVNRAGKSPLCLSLTQLFSLTKSISLKNLWQNQVLFRRTGFASIRIQGCAQILSAAAMDAELPPRCGDTSLSLNNAQFKTISSVPLSDFFLVVHSSQAERHG